MSQRIAVQLLIHQLVEEATFYKVTYDAPTGKPVQIDTEDESQRITPASVEVNETDGRFDTDEDQGRKLSLIKADWSFKCVIAFKDEAVMEYFEKMLSENLPKLPSDRSKGWRQVTLYLASYRVEHPVRQEPTHGTKATIAFKAKLGRV